MIEIPFNPTLTALLLNSSEPAYRFHTLLRKPFGLMKATVLNRFLAWLTLYQLYALGEPVSFTTTNYMTFILTVTKSSIVNFLVNYHISHT